MKLLRNAVAIGAVGVAFCFVCETTAMTLYVAPEGNDACTGMRMAADGKKSDGPLATLEGARSRVRQIRGLGTVKEPITVVFAAGEYGLDKPVVFGPEDSGTPESPVTYTADADKPPVFFGGRKLPPFAAGTDGVWRADLSLT